MCADRDVCVMSHSPACCVVVLRMWLTAQPSGCSSVAKVPPLWTHRNTRGLFHLNTLTVIFAHKGQRQGHKQTLSAAQTHTHIFKLFLIICKPHIIMHKVPTLGFLVLLMGKKQLDQSIVLC